MMLKEQQEVVNSTKLLPPIVLGTIDKKNIILSKYKSGDS
jgi:hypothetical protein